MLEYWFQKNNMAPASTFWFRKWKSEGVKLLPKLTELWWHLQTLDDKNWKAGKTAVDVLNNNFEQSTPLVYNDSECYILAYVFMCNSCATTYCSMIISGIFHFKMIWYKMMPDDLAPIWQATVTFDLTYWSIYWRCSFTGTIYVRWQPRCLTECRSRVSDTCPLTACHHNAGTTASWVHDAYVSRWLPDVSTALSHPRAGHVLCGASLVPHQELHRRQRPRTTCPHSTQVKTRLPRFVWVRSAVFKRDDK